MYVAGGGDPEAKATVVALLCEYGWREIIDVGDLTAARAMEMMMPMWLRLSDALGTSMCGYRLVGDRGPT